MFTNFWDYVLNPVFLVTFGLVAAFFVPMLWSMWVTWNQKDNSHK